MKPFVETATLLSFVTGITMVVVSSHLEELGNTDTVTRGCAYLLISIFMRLLSIQLVLEDRE